MAGYFCDSSAIVKRYIRETGTGWIIGLMRSSAKNEFAERRNIKTYKLNDKTVNGNVFSIIKKNKILSSPENYELFIEKVINKINSNTENIKLSELAKMGDKISKYKYDQNIADAIIDELGGLVEYIKYE